MPIIRCSRLLTLAAALLAGIPSFAATISGNLRFNDLPANYFDPALHYAPGYAGNSAGTSVAVGPGIEFAFEDGTNLNTADFSDGLLTIRQLTRSSGAATTTFSFTADTTDFFKYVVLGANTTGGTVSVSGNVLTFTTPFVEGAADRAATINLAAPESPSLPVPEPATWAMMLAGFAVIGSGMRQGRVRPARA